MAMALMAQVQGSKKVQAYPQGMVGSQEKSAKRGSEGEDCAYMAAKVPRNSSSTLGFQKPHLTQDLSLTWQHPGYPRSNSSSTCSEWRTFSVRLKIFP